MCVWMCLDCRADVVFKEQADGHPGPSDGTTAGPESSETRLNTEPRRTKERRNDTRSRTCTRKVYVRERVNEPQRDKLRIPQVQQ